MITLCGIPLSNYYNKVKLALLEKGIPFTEDYVKTHSDDEAVLACTPLGKVPFIKTAQGALCESQVIMDYLEAAYPDTPRLVPADPYAAAKVRELITYVELHLELVARELYAEAFFGGKVSDGTKQRVARVLPANIAAFKRLAKFGPTSRATSSRWPTARPGSACRWWPRRPRSCSAKTCSPQVASTGSPTPR